MKVIKEAYGQVVQGTSSKQYLVALIEEDGGTFGVVSFNGRIAAPKQQPNSKATGLASQDAAEVAFAAVLKDKAKYNFGAIPKPAELNVVAMVASGGRVA